VRPPTEYLMITNERQKTTRLSHSWPDSECRVWGNTVEKGQGFCL
jgi:hypothetical protein